MKGWLKLLVLGAIPILAVTMVADPAFAADKGSQLIFQSNMAHQNYVSVVNASDDAVTVLVQYYNNEMEMAVWYLRVILGGTNVLVDPFDHMIPGSDPAVNVGDAIMGSGKGGNGHFVIAVTAVGANTVDTDDDTTAGNDDEIANILFPSFLAEDMHGTDNIDNCGSFSTDGMGTAYTPHGEDGVNDCADGTETDVDEDETSKNVGDLSVGNAEPVSFNHMTGNFTEALTGTDAGGSDQTASWGGTPVVRPAVDDTNNAMAEVMNYWTLNGLDPDNGGGRLAEKDAGGMEVNVHGENGHVVSGFTAIADGNEIVDGTRNIRGINGGALVLPAIYGGGAETKQIMLLLSVADDFGGAGKYKLMSAMTGYDVILMDQMGNPLDMEDAASDPVFGGGAEAEDMDAASTMIIVNGIGVMTNADLAKCTGTMIDGPMTLGHLTGLVPEATAGGKKFAGLDAETDPMMNASPGWIKVARTALTCEKDYGDGDAADLTAIENADGVPVADKRTYTAGTLIVEEMSADRSFVTTGRALLKFITPSSTFAASWTLKSPASPMDTDN